MSKDTLHILYETTKDITAKGTDRIFYYYFMSFDIHCPHGIFPALSLVHIRFKSKISYFTRHKVLDLGVSA